MIASTWSTLSLGLMMGFAVATVGCAPIPPPRIVAQADEVAVSKAALDAKTAAPSAFAKAEKLRADAHAALDHDRAARAQVIAEEAIAAYQEASALARVARAQRTEQLALIELEKSTGELSGLEVEEARVRAEVDALESRLRITRDAQPIVASGSATPGREEARKQAAHAMVVQAKLLCGASQLLGATTATSAPASPEVAATPATPSAPEDPTSPGVIARDLKAAQGDIDKLDAELAASGPTPIDLATRTRASCLSVLTRVRRASAKSAQAAGVGDALLQELSAYAGRDGGALAPARDERGVAVTLRGVFDGETLSSGATARLTELDRVAATHPDFAVEIVLHSDKALSKSDDERWRARGEKIASAFKSVPKGRVSTLVAGNFSPLVDPHGKDKAKNLRVEIVFVSPESL